MTNLDAEQSIEVELDLRGDHDGFKTADGTTWVTLPPHSFVTVSATLA